MQLEKSVMHVQSFYFAKPIAFFPFSLFSFVPTTKWGGALRDDTKNGCVAD